jgi:hypothetical protein
MLSLVDYFFAALIFAQRAFCAAAILLRTEADIVRCRLTPLFAKTLPAAFSARIFAQRARVAAAILARPAAEIWRVGTGVSATFCTDIPWPVSAANNAKTCCNRSISARTSLTMLSLLNVFPRVARCDTEG